MCMYAMLLKYHWRTITFHLNAHPAKYLTCHDTATPGWLANAQELPHFLRTRLGSGHEHCLSVPDRWQGYNARPVTNERHFSGSGQWPFVWDCSNWQMGPIGVSYNPVVKFQPLPTHLWEVLFRSTLFWWWSDDFTISNKLCLIEQWELLV